MRTNVIDAVGYAFGPGGIAADDELRREARRELMDRFFSPVGPVTVTESKGNSTQIDAKSVVENAPIRH